MASEENDAGYRCLLREAILLSRLQLRSAADAVVFVTSVMMQSLDSTAAGRQG